jgi:hypothetical protein
MGYKEKCSRTQFLNFRHHWASQTCNVGKLIRNSDVRLRHSKAPTGKKGGGCGHYTALDSGAAQRNTTQTTQQASQFVLELSRRSSSGISCTSFYGQAMQAFRNCLKTIPRLLVVQTAASGSKLFVLPGTAVESAPYCMDERAFLHTKCSAPIAGTSRV